VNEKTLLSGSFDRYQKLVGKKNIYVSTTNFLEKTAKKQLPGLTKGNLFLEPCRKDRGPAIGLATLCLDYVKPSSTVFFAWSDHYFNPEENLLKSLFEVGSFVSANPGRFGVVGVKPEFPHTGLGYIKMGKEAREGFRKFEGFVEKPDEKTARRFIDSGKYLWNLGAFCFNTSTLLGFYEEYLPEVFEVLMKIKAKLHLKDKQKWIDKYYKEMPECDFEKALIEKLPTNLAVVKPVDVKWADVGGFKALRDVLKDTGANCTLGQTVLVDSEDNLILNFSKKQFVGVVGVKDSVVAVTDNAVLVSNINDTEKVKQLLKKMGENGFEKFV
jgi:mannose-1-phosphate guanylyltransferase